MCKQIVLKTIFLITFIIVVFITNAISQESLMDKQIHERFLQAQKMMGKKNFDSAIESFKEIIRDDSDFGKGYEWLALAFSYGERLTAAQEYWDSLIERDSLNAYVQFGVGRWRQAIHNDQKAISRYKKAINLGCKYPSLYSNAAVVWRSLGKLKEAISVFEQLTQQERTSHLAHYGLAYVYYLNSKWKEAEEYIDSALQTHDFPEAELLKAMILNQPGGRQEQVKEICKAGIESADLDLNLQLKADFLGQLSRAYRHKSNNAQELESLEKALLLYKDIGNQRAEGLTLGKIAGLYRRQGRLKQALTYYEQSLKILRQIRDRRSEGTFVNGLAIVYTKLGKYEKATESYQRAIIIARQVGNLRGEANALTNVGNLISNQGNYPQASEYYEKALQIFRKIGIKRAEAGLLVNLGILAQSQGEYQRALEYYQQGLNAAQALKSKLHEGGVRANRGNVYNYLGHYARAMEEYQAALDIFTEIDNKPFKASVLGSMADIHRQLGNYEAALSLIQQTLVVEREAGNKREEGLKLESLAIIYTDTGDYSKALEYYRKALLIQEQLKNKPAVSYILANMGVAYELSGNYDEARRHYERSLSIAKATGEKRNEGQLYNHLGSYYSRITDYSTSEQFHRRAIQVGEAIDMPEIVWDARIGLAVVLSKQDRIEEALNQYKDAIRIIEDVEKNISADDSRIGFRERRQRGYEQLMSMLWRLRTQNSTKDFDKEMFYLAERTRARSLLDLVHEGNIFQFLDEVTPDFRSRFLANATKLDELREQLQEAGSQADSSLVQTIQKRLRAAESLHGQLLSEIKQGIPKYYDLITPTVLTLEQAQRKVLKEGQLLLQYFVGEDNTYVFSLTRNDFSVTALDIGAEEIARILTDVSPLFQRKAEPPLLTSKENMGNAPVRKDASWSQINLDGLHQLYNRIFEPVVKGHPLERKELIIVPDDILFYFPFEMLVTKFEQDKPRYLLQDHVISYSASVSLLNPELQRQREPNRELLAMGNPAFGKSKAGITRVFASMFKTVFRNDQWVPLPYSENEVKDISKNFKNSEVLIGIDATEGKFKQTASQYRYLHLATHYLADDRQPMFSKIVFAQAPDNTEEDGYLHTFEVFNLGLNAELVTLSACNTALGQFRKGEGLIGISRAFMYAGVPSLVVSLWPVEDESTAYLMSQFYKYLARGEAKNLALQKAKIDLRKSDLEKNDPFYWAPFVLIGDWK